MSSQKKLRNCPHDPTLPTSTMKMQSRASVSIQGPNNKHGQMQRKRRGGQLQSLTSELYGIFRDDTGEVRSPCFSTWYFPGLWRWNHSWADPFLFLIVDLVTSVILQNAFEIVFIFLTFYCVLWWLVLEEGRREGRCAWIHIAWYLGSSPDKYCNFHSNT